MGTWFVNSPQAVALGEWEAQGLNWDLIQTAPHLVGKELSQGPSAAGREMQAGLCCPLC